VNAEQPSENIERDAIIRVMASLPPYDRFGRKQPHLYWQS
jgi:hypothetical protein